jgi:hypothetical protein
MPLSFEPGFLIAMCAVAVISIVFGAILNAILADDGFGPVGNAVVLMAGFYVAVFAAKWQGMPIRDTTFAMATGMGGGFACFALLAILKGGITRLRQ